MTDDDIVNLIELLNHGEYGIAPELLSTQLFEYEVIIDEKIYQRIGKAGVALSLCEDTGNLLKVE
ncbi:MAG TPA: hypothetical protein VGU61_06315 [Noviherbaspirillum sp.]|uniref:hypothetical protein n=1 Tax=Noviherbaspirillum sp. TaxID=1926288 RepID=UPI002DDD7397|nr:hypothetical protein [Noviherbaspirillum sp.]HEV2609862.1 hypothetical protein [Noviherbaspirillum sp.]